LGRGIALHRANFHVADEVWKHADSANQNKHANRSYQSDPIVIFGVVAGFLYDLVPKTVFFSLLRLTNLGRVHSQEGLLSIRTETRVLVWLGRVVTGLLAAFFDLAGISEMSLPNGEIP
jgi:hypothetical protein